MKTIYLFLLLLTTVSVVAQDIPPLIGDRPDQTESAWTIPKDMIQIESGFNFESYLSGDSEYKNIDYNSTLIRWGIGNQFEFRFQQDFSQHSFTNKIQNQDTSYSGASGTSIGMKILLADEKGWIPRIAFLGSLGLPQLGNKEFVSDYFAPAFRFSFEHTITNNFSLGYNLGGEWLGDNSSMIGFYSFVGGYGIGSRIGLFTELFGFLPEQGNAEHFFDAGLTFSILPNLQYDFAAGMALTNSNSYFFTTGIIWRLSY